MTCGDGMRLGLIAFAAVLSIGGPGQAADYYLTSTQTNQAMFMDLDTVRSASPSIKRFWIANVMLADPRAAYMMVLSEMSCADQTTKALHIAAYDDHGTLLTAFNPQNDAAVVVANTPAEVQLKLACDLEPPSEALRLGDVDPLVLRSALTAAKKQTR